MNNEDTDFNEPSDEGTAGTAPEGVPTNRRPLGFWLRVVDGLITREFAAAFDGADLDRRDWMLLNALSGDVELPAIAERFIRKGKRLRGLAERGWVDETGDGTWVLTDDGRAAKERLGEVVDGIRARIAGAVSPEDFATTMASLEAIARELGWEDGQRMPRGGFGRGRAFGPGFGREFGPGFGRDFRSGRGFGRGFGGGRPGFGPDGGDADSHGDALRREGYGPRGEGYGPCGERHGHPHHSHEGHPHGGHRGHGRGEGRGAERAYERGFDAGFARGSSGDRVAPTDTV